MFGCFFNSSNKQGSADAGFESAFFCASFFAALLLLVDTVIAVSIFVCAGIPAALTVFALVCVVFLHVLRVLLAISPVRRSKPLAVSI